MTNNNVNVTGGKAGHWTHGNEYDKLKDKKVLDGLKSPSKEDSATYTVFNTKQDTKSPHLALRTKPTSGKKATTVVKMKDGTKVIRLKKKKGSWLYVKVKGTDKKGWCNAFWLKSSAADGFSVKPTHEIYNTSKDKKAPYLALRTYPTAGKGSATAPASTIAQMPDGTQIYKFTDPGSKKGKWVKIQILDSNKPEIIGLAGWAHSKFMKKSNMKGAIASADIYKVIVTYRHDVEDEVSIEHIIKAKPQIRELALNIILSNNGMTKEQIGENPLDIKKQILDSVKTTDLYDVPTGKNTGGTQVKYLVLYKNGKKEQDLIKKAIAHKPDKTEYSTQVYEINKHLEDLDKLKHILSAVTTKIKQHEQEEGRYIYNFDVIKHNSSQYPKETQDRLFSFVKLINEGIDRFDSENPSHKGHYKHWHGDRSTTTKGRKNEKKIKYSWTIPENEKPIMKISNIHFLPESIANLDGKKDGATHEVFNTKGAKDGEYLALRNKPSNATGKDGKKKKVKTLVQMVDGTRVKQATKKGKGIKGGKKKKWFKLIIVDPRHKNKNTSGWAHSKWLKKPDSETVTYWAPSKENDIVTEAVIKQSYDPYFINIIYHIEEIVKKYPIWPNQMTKSTAVEFVGKYFVKPPLEQQVIPREARRVFNEGKIKYKNQRNIQEETLNDRIKRDIHETVKFKYQNTSDQVFLSMIKDIGSMKTVEDIYEKVLYAIPVSELIKTVAECLMKGLSLPDLKAAICDNILKDIDEEILNKVLAHLGTSQSGVAAVIKGKMEKVMTENAPSSEALGEGPGANVYNETMGDLIASSVDSVSEKDALCVAILAIAPVALLSALDLPVDPDLERGLILNPAKHFLQSIQDRINQYSITGLTQGWKDLITQLIDDLIEEFIVNAIQKLLKEIAILCEGSAKADMAGMPGIEGATLPPAFLDPTMPFAPFDLTDHLRATGNDDIYDDLIDTFDFDENVSVDLIKSFLDDLTNLLTVSEICTLLDEDASDINKTYIAGKVWSALIEEGEYAILGSKLGGIPGLIQFFYVLGMKVDQQYCVDKIDALRRTKKVLSDLCGPASNGALIEDLKNKVTQDVIDDLLNQEKDIAKDTLDTLLNLADPSRITKQVPPLFCGPDAENSTKEPLFDSHQHDSAKFLTEKFLKQIISGITKQFEQDLTFYKSIFLTPKLDMIGITNEVPSITASVFKLTEKVEDAPEQTDKDALNKLLDNYQYIAKKVHKLLSESQDGINVSAHTDDDFLSIYASAIISDEVVASEENRLSLNMNYGDVPQSAQGAAEVDPGTSTIIVGGLEQQSNTNLSPYKDLVGIINSFTSNAYDTTIKKQVVEGLEFYAYLLKTVIVEHAEHITQLDLFKKKNFDKLELKKVESDDPCAGSLLFPDNILQKVDEHTQALECKKEFSDIPAAYEVAQINLYVDILHRLVLIEQMLKSVFVFVAYDIYSLLPENDYDNSFYYKYISSQVKNRLNSFSSFQSINFNINEVIEKYSTQVYAAMEDLEIKSDISQDTQIIQDTKKWLLNEAFADVRNTFTERLSKPKLIGTEFEGTLEEELVDVQAGSTPPAKQVLQNIISPVQKDPPIIEKIDYKNRKFFVAKGTYSDDPKLQNGGFFLERGFEFVPKYGPPDNVISDGGAWKFPAGGNTTILNKIETIYDFVKAPPPDLESIGWDFALFAELLRFFTPNIDTEAGLFGAFRFFSQTSKLSIALSAEAEEENFILDGYFDFIGKMSLDEYFKEYSILSSHQNLEEYTIDAVIQSFGAGDQIAAETGKEHYDTYMLPLFQNNEIFTRYTDYYSLNLLLVVPEDANSILRKKYNSILESASQFDNLISDGQIEESFYDALSDKKYFIQETGGKLYFKLPLIVRYPFEEENPNYSDLQKMNEFKNHLWTAPGLGGKGKLLSQLAEDPLFVYFTNIINYKDLLSYIALIVTESLEQEYSDLKTLFDRTIIAVLNALGAALSGANRQMDPEFYQDSNFNAGATAPGIEWVGVMFKALIKSLATMVDPTWQTDWFMPGPFTPFGVTAKLLEGLDEDEEDEEGEGEAETTECFDSVDDSGEPSPGDGVQDPDE